MKIFLGWSLDVLVNLITTICVTFNIEVCLKMLILLRNQSSGLPTRDLLSAWISLFSDDLSLALGSERNIFNPNINLSKLLLLNMNEVMDGCLGSVLGRVLATSGALARIVSASDVGVKVNSLI